VRETGAGFGSSQAHIGADCTTVAVLSNCFSGSLFRVAATQCLCDRSRFGNRQEIEPGRRRRPPGIKQPPQRFGSFPHYYPHGDCRAAGNPIAQCVTGFWEKTAIAPGEFLMLPSYSRGPAPVRWISRLYLLTAGARISRRNGRHNSVVGKRHKQLTLVSSPPNWIQIKFSRHAEAMINHFISVLSSVSPIGYNHYLLPYSYRAKPLKSGGPRESTLVAFPH